MHWQSVRKIAIQLLFWKLFLLSAGLLSAQADEEVALFQQDDLEILYGNVQRPNGMVWFDEKLYVACSGDWTIYEIDIESGTTRTYIFGVQNAHSLYAEVGLNEKTELWVPDFVTHDLLRINPLNAPITVLAGGLAGGWDIAYLDDDRFLISNLLSDSVLTVSRFGEVETVVERLRSPTGLVVDGGAFYVANTGSVRRSIEWFTLRQIAALDEPLDASRVESATLVSGLQNVSNLGLAADGMLYFAYSEGALGVIGRVDAHHCRDQGGCSIEEVVVVVRTALAAPLAGLTLTPDGRLYFHSLYKPEIYWLQLPKETISQAESTPESES